jgi:hypothetical protein
MTLLVTNIILCRMIGWLMYKEWEIILKKEVVALFKARCQNFHRGTEENHENLSQDRPSLGRDLKPALPNTK